MYFALDPSSSPESIQVLGFRFNPDAAPSLSSTKLAWSGRAIDTLRSISEIAAASGQDAGLKLPYSTLRALLSASLPNPLYVASDLSLPNRSTSERTFSTPFAECQGDGADCGRAVNAALRSWVSKVLAPWAEARGVPSELVAQLVDIALENELVDVSQGYGAAPGAAEPNFSKLRDLVHSALRSALAGKELFEGLGSVRCLIRSKPQDNSISFLSFPTRASGGSWSMNARLTVETLPGEAIPFVRLDVSRTRWCGEVPSSFMPRQRKISATVFGVDDKRAVSFDVPIVKGQVQEPEDPAYALSALRSGIDIGQSFASLIKAGPDEGAFVGIRFAPAYEPAPTIATGATELDWLECYDRILAEMQGMFTPLESRSVPKTKRTARKNEDIPALNAASILEDVARALGHNDIDNKAIADAWDALHGGELPKGVAMGPDVQSARRRFDDLKQGNAERLTKTFGDTAPTIVVLSGNASEGAAIVEIVQTLFAGRIKIENRLMPTGVHGSRKSLPGSEKVARERYDLRLQAWRPLAELLRDDFGPSRVLVHATRFQDDPVNKIAGRVALARYGDCNVQYLDARGRNANEWFFRIQAAVLDLLFGHSGLVSPVAENVAQAFPDALTAPKSILGISVVAQNQTYGRSSSSFFLCVKIEVATGKTTATAACPKDGDLEFKGPLPFFDLLKTVAGWEGTSVGNRDTAKSAFQQFLSTVVEAACDQGENPLVMIDGTHGRSLWPTIANSGWAGPHVLDNRSFVAARDWPGARIVRIQESIEPHVITRKFRRYVGFDAESSKIGDGIAKPVPTLTDAGRLLRIDGAAENYISVGDLDGQQKIAKGLSVYRVLSHFKKVANIDPPPGLEDRKIYEPSPRDLTAEPYKLPGVIGVLVLHHLPEDDADRIAGLCHGLRNGFGHTRSPTKLPTPLFQTRKVAEYIPAYVLEGDDVDDASGEDVAAEDSSDDIEPAETDFDEVPENTVKRTTSTAASILRSTSNLGVRGITPIDVVGVPLLPTGRGSPLLALAEGRASQRSLPSLTSLLTPAPLPVLSPPLQSASIQGSLPDDLQARIAGDFELAQILSRWWLGPLPGFMDQDWMISLISSGATKTRSLMPEVFKDLSPIRHVLPEVDSSSDASLAEFVLALMCLGDGMTFLQLTLQGQMSKSFKRWMFKPIFEQLYHNARQIRKNEPPSTTVAAFNSGNLGLFLQLDKAGHRGLIQQFLILEPMFSPSCTQQFAEAAERLRADLGSGYAEVAAFCLRLAKYRTVAKEVRTEIADYVEKARSLAAPKRIGLKGMPDADEVAAAPSIPETPAPAVDAAFLTDKVSLSGAFRSHLHSHRELIRGELGDARAWPDEKPAADQIAACVARLFSVPTPLLAAIGSRDKEPLFRPLYRKIENTMRVVEEGKPPSERIDMTSWIGSGAAPQVFLRLVENGYLAYASELAFIRAVDNPSQSLEDAVKQAGSEFSEVARFVQARRQATIWFLKNDQRADHPLYSKYLRSFEEGELPMQETGALDLVQEEHLTDIVEPSSAESDATEVAVTTSSLDAALAEIAVLAQRGIAAHRSGGFDELDMVLEKITALSAEAVEATRLLPRGVPNDRLVERAAAVRMAALALAEELDLDLAVESVPHSGEVRSSDADSAIAHLDIADQELVQIRAILDDAAALRVKATQVKFSESGQIYADVQDRLTSATEKLGTVAREIDRAILSLTPISGLVLLEAAQTPSSEAVIENSATTVSDQLAPDEEPISRFEQIDPAATSQELSTNSEAFDEEFDAHFDVEALDELEILIAETVVSTTPLAAPLPEKPTDVPDLSSQDEAFDGLDSARIDQALEEYVAAGSFGLAYHLARAAEIEVPGRNLSITSGEAKLVALAGHLNHTALQSSTELVESWVQEAFRAADAIERDEDRERSTSRLLSLMPLMIELGIFFPFQGAAEFLRKFGALPGTLGSKAQEVFESVGRIQHTNITFSRAMLANVANELDCSKALEETRLALLKRFDLFSIAKFDFQLAMKMRNELLRTDNVVGALRAQLNRNRDDQKTLEAMKEFTDRIRDRGRIVELFAEVELQINDRYQGLDGVARNRMVSFFEDFRDLANEYIELMSEVEEAKTSERPKAREFAKQIARAVEEMVLAVDGASTDIGRVAQSARHAAPRLRKIARILSGEAGVAPASSTDIFQACHAEMALIPELEYGRSWLPSPYDPPRIVDLLCDQAPPLLPAAGQEREAAFEAAVRTRMDRSSYVGARLLLDAAPFFGISEELTANLLGEFETGVAAAKEAMKSDFDVLRRMVERVVRFGSLRQGTDAEEASAMLDRIEKLEAVEVPASVQPGDRTEQPMEGIYDVSVAIDEVEAIKSEAQELLDEPRNRLERRIDELAGKGTALELVAQLRNLCQTDDLLTAEEAIDEVARTGRFSESRSANGRFKLFSETVLPALAPLKHEVALEAAAAIRDGDTYGGLSFEALSDARREESASVMEQWRELFRKFHDFNFSAHVAVFLEKIGIKAMVDNVASPPRGLQKTFVGDFRAIIPLDRESLLLPDFGSRTEGVYRLIVSQSMPSESVISEHCRVGKLGVILFVNDIVPPQQRKTFHHRNLIESRRVLLVDSASILFSLSEPAIRPLTLIELAQPYSFVAPYNDWGRDAVPPEMFVGREEDIARILDPEGSNIVYGGRRMGKTAILRHLANVAHNPSHGMLVAFVDAHTIGRGNMANKTFWSSIAGALPDVFPANPPQDPRRIREAIQAWLEADGRRRILLLLDECDLFIVSDAANGFSEFLELQQLMTNTKRRFKFVLAGLSDVTRLVQTGNPPLKQIAANPRRIGSLTGDERKDAEDLLLRPFAALGLEFVRSDVWRILSYANYYPVLIQTYAQRILQAVLNETKTSQKVTKIVSSDLVTEVLDNVGTRSEIKRIFEFTLDIDPRYRLIAYVVANLVFQAEAEGRIDDGFPLHQIRDNAINFWEAGFEDRNRFSLFDDLLDEMEGLGIVRKISGDKWTLRSSAVVRMLGNRDEIESAILEFGNKKAPVGFDPKSHRRDLQPAKNVLAETRTSPLTLGQERDILTTRARATVIVGHKLADYALAAWAIKSVPESFSDGEIYEARILSAVSPAEFDASIRDLKVPSGRKILGILPASAPWTSEWVRSAVNSKPVSRGEVKLVFVGSPEHAASVYADEELAALTSHICIVPLEPWSRAFFSDTVNRHNLVALSQSFDALAASTGGWNLPMWNRLLGGAKRQPDVVDAETIALSGRFGKAIAAVARLHGPSAMSSHDIQDYIELDEELASLGVSAKGLIDYGIAMGLLFTAAGRPSGERDRTRYVLAPLAASVLQIEEKAAAE
ncbi:RNaseH domain-containing protein [Rhizobium leguminosarum]|uniref:DUF3893 domain-containing protein n=1 Tax=Rhizobium leguminosarum TaxID=384 RepID=A0A7M3DWD4_RHILE|nr:RNaseH domain-containing protein [Rhizobium leguminosarum]TAY52976.1 DUF3893 domain-containing protein [Rhizobium leguminosarum]